MAKRSRRSDVFHHNEVGVAHCVQRCVRRAFLAGKDPVTGKTYEYRRDWIRKRMELLASVFGLDVLTYAVMSNHLHIMLRTRPDVVKTWNDEEIARRWLRLFPGRRLEDFLGEPTKQDIANAIGNAKKIAEWRKRLSDISWFMRALAEPIARKPTKKTNALDDFGKVGLRLRRSSTKQDCWLVPCMWISILFEPPLRNRQSNRSSLRPTIGSRRNLGIDRFQRFASLMPRKRTLQHCGRSWKRPYARTTAKRWPT